MGDMTEQSFDPRPIRLATVATAPPAPAALAALRKIAGKRIEHIVHLGDRKADYKANSFFRLRPVQGTRGDLMQGDRFRGAASSLETGPKLEEQLIEAIDNLTRGSDQMAYKFHGIQSYQDYQHITHIAYDVFGRMLIDERITHVLFFDIPHMFYDTCLKQVADALGIRVLILRQSFFPRQFFSMSGSYDFGHLAPRASDLEAEPWPLPEKGPELFYMKGLMTEAADPGKLSPRGISQMLTHHLVNAPLKLLNPVYMTRLLRRMRAISRQFPDWRDPFFHYFHTDHLHYFEHLAKYENQTVDLERPFIYFPLQLQPEMTTSSLGGRFRDLTLAIEQTANLLPDDHLIYVKENPKQPGKMRSPLFLRRLERIDKVRIMPSHTDSKTLLTHAIAVANVSGTIGWEAVCAGKPAICFGAAWWAEAPGVTRFRPGLSLDEILSNTASKEEAESFAGRLQARSHRGNVQRKFAAADTGFSEEENGQEVAEAILGLLEGTIPLTFDPVDEAGGHASGAERPRPT